MKVIPAVNSKTREDAEEKIKKAAEFSDWIHLDIVDGEFAPNKTWGSPSELRSLISNFQFLISKKFEVHLMVVNPEEAVEQWLKTGAVKRAIVHIEAMTDPEKIVKICEKYGVEAMLAEGPEIDPSQLPKYKDYFKSFQILGVTAGKAGQKLRPEVIKKARLLRESLPDVRIEVDGGVNPATGKLAKDAGADILVSASYIFAATDPKKAYEKLVNL